MSSEPKRATVWAIAPLTAASSRTSTTSGRAWPPACSIASAAEWIVPSSFGCGVSVFAAIAILAPSRAARSAIASPMPRDAPVMNSVFPASDTSVSFFSGSLLAREKGGERGARLIGLQALLKVHGLGIDAPEHVVKVAAHEFPRQRHRARRQCGDFACRLQGKLLQ